MNAPATKNSPLARYEVTSRDAKLVTDLLRDADEHFHVITPATVCPHLPEGFEIATTSVTIDVDRETYDARPRRERQAERAAQVRAMTHGGDRSNEPRCLGKSALDRIALAAGVSWDAVQTRRIDDGSHPHFCVHQAVGTIRQFDGTLAVLPIGTRPIDLRLGSRQIAGMSDERVAQMRATIERLSETMARLRVLRSLGIRSSYERQELLKKPFLVVHLLFTGATDDPELRKMFARMTAEAVLGAQRSLYGAPASLAAPVPVELRRPPAVPDADWDEDDVEPARRSAKTVGGPRVPSEEPRREPAPPPASASGATSERAVSGFVIPGGHEEGVPVEDASDRTLAYWVAHISRKLDAGEARYPEKDAALVDAMIAVQSARAARAQGGRPRPPQTTYGRRS